MLNNFAFPKIFIHAPRFVKVLTINVSENTTIIGWENNKNTSNFKIYAI